MATSKSRERWTAGALLYSGRRDPEWEVSAEVVNALWKLWDAMAPSLKTAPSASRLGYRGVYLRGAGGREWSVFNGLVTLNLPARAEVRTDPAREFERLLLASAPKGLLPENFVGPE